MKYLGNDDNKNESNELMGRGNLGNDDNKNKRKQLIGIGNLGNNDNNKANKTTNRKLLLRLLVMLAVKNPVWGIFIYGYLQPMSLIF